MEQKFKVGDKVRVIGKGWEDEPGFANCWVASMDSALGQIFTVKNVTQAGVYFTERLSGFPPSGLELVVIDDEIQKALTLLKSVGDVTFKKRKPSFVNVLVKDVGSYTAQITEQAIIVGCTTIDFKKFDEIATAVAKARKHNEEN